MSEQKNDEIIDIEPQIISDSKAEEAPPKRVLPMRRFAVGAVSGLAFAIAGGWVYRDLLVNYLPSDQMQILAHKVEALEATNNDSLKRVDAVVALTEELKAKLGAAQASADRSAKLNGEATQQVQQDALLLSQLQADLTDVKTKLAAGAGSSSSGTDVALALRVDALEKAMGAAKVQAPAESAMLLQPALAVLKTKLDAGDPYADALVPLQLVVSKTAGLDALNAEAEHGLPNAKQLAQEMASRCNTIWLRWTDRFPIVRRVDTWWKQRRARHASLHGLTRFPPLIRSSVRAAGRASQ